MSKIKRVTITLEAERILAVKNWPRPGAWCAACGQWVQMVTVSEARTLAGVSEMTVYRRVEAGALHFTETVDGRLFICLGSLLNQL